MLSFIFLIARFIFFSVNEVNRRPIVEPLQNASRIEQNFSGRITASASLSDLTRPAQLSISARWRSVRTPPDAIFASVAPPRPPPPAATEPQSVPRLYPVLPRSASLTEMDPYVATVLPAPRSPSPSSSTSTAASSAPPAPSAPPLTSATSCSSLESHAKGLIPGVLSVADFRRLPSSLSQPSRAELQAGGSDEAMDYAPHDDEAANDAQPDDDEAVDDAQPGRAEDVIKRAVDLDLGPLDQRVEIKQRALLTIRHHPPPIRARAGGRRGSRRSVLQRWPPRGSQAP